MANEANEEATTPQKNDDLGRYRFRNPYFQTEIHQWYAILLICQKNIHFQLHKDFFLMKIFCEFVHDCIYLKQPLKNMIIL